jgi:hypothetical protein
VGWRQKSPFSRHLVSQLCPRCRASCWHDQLSREKRLGDEIANSRALHETLSLIPVFWECKGFFVKFTDYKLFFSWEVRLDLSKCADMYAGP